MNFQTIILLIALTLLFVNIRPHQTRSSTRSNSGAAKGCSVWEGRRLLSTNGRTLPLQYSLGLGEETGEIYIAEKVITTDTYTPDVLAFPAASKTLELIRDPSRPQRVIADPGEKGGYTSQSIKQVRGRETFVDIVVLSEWEYEIRFYQPQQVRSKRGGFYRVAGDPFSVTRIRNPDPPYTDSVEITTTKADGAQQQSLFKYDTPGDSWSMSIDGVEKTRKYSEVNADDPCERIETRYDLEEGNWVKTVKIYRGFPWGQDIVKMIEDPDGDPKTTTYKYWDDPNGPHYSFLKTTIHPDGTIEKHNRHPDPFKNWKRKP